jgi:hypothetical protein
MKEHDHDKLNSLSVLGGYGVLCDLCGFARDKILKWALDAEDSENCSERA